MSSTLLPTLSEAMVRRQPVVRADRTVHGYAVSVVVRPPKTRAQEVRSIDDLVHEQYERLDLATLAGTLVVFVRATTAMCTSDWPLPETPGGLILEVPPAFAGLPDAIEHLVRLRAAGVGLALGDFQPGGAQDALLPHVDFAKVDLERGTAAAAAAISLAHLHAVTVVAERVDTEAAVTFCAAHRVELLQGPLFQRDAPTTTREFTAGEQQCFGLLTLLARAGDGGEVDYDAVVAMIKSDPELTMRVLHLVNSAAYALRGRVDSVHQAVVLLGPVPLSSLAAAAIVHAGDHTMSGLWFVLTRATACRTLAGDDAAYTVGLLSAVASQQRIAPAALIARTGVSADVAMAVESLSGTYGPVLAAVLAYEENDFSTVEATGLPLFDVARGYLGAVTDALGTVTTLSSVG
ncbi:EAL and HDOD domain-containing protein [Pengzhenrongella sicca]|uniref:HDOD domain-containing protein n=1 Tax=Pengzhenrongella sicca TaxID=2819238 RepID=A0A8A4ZH65_9MICO|nr:HDOD domain-containing protein [Pengzhenrongella sicca]QTE29847.1 HDOD domain-containing protein [Pengzhenrongella sicca]